MEINEKYLKGLKFNEVERKEVKENGEKKTVSVVTERDLIATDVLAVRETETEIIFVTADGQKYTKPLIREKK